MSKKIKWLTDKEAKFLDLSLNVIPKNRRKARYSLTQNQWDKIIEFRKNRVEVKSEIISETTDYKQKEKFVLSAWNKDRGEMMDIDEYCKHYSLPRKDITSYKLVSHTGTPYYNIVFKENKSEEVATFDIESIVKKHIKPVNYKLAEFNVNVIEQNYSDFDSLTYSDVHIGMETNSKNNSMYAVEWNRETILEAANIMTADAVINQSSSILIVDELGDLLDGYNAQTTRGGHALPQNMTNEEAFDCALEFKMIILDGLTPYYDRIYFNNICNDNHAGSFGYFLNKAFKEIAELKYKDKVTVDNHRKFISHYFVENIAFLITHGKDDSSLKFGFKPKLDPKQIEKIDQYCKQNDIYKKSDLVIFKKGDSHQALFDMCTSDDFYYYNYPALSPSSQWVQTNFKKGRRGYVLESFNGLNSTQKTRL